eukprot:TRINITY_DN74831_c0_g1_i1.p1 TRINITY_DN74831_c0_g1~~TRINITY_DN74831_c0_g1_i1.p1  ORF type:complete len:319 (+),score=122.72 TRINITY_DN74831_c0_g1_i1:162-1118(+)
MSKMNSWAAEYYYDYYGMMNTEVPAENNLAPWAAWAEDIELALLAQAATTTDKRKTPVMAEFICNWRPTDSNSVEYDRLPATAPLLSSSSILAAQLAAPCCPRQKEGAGLHHVASGSTLSLQSEEEAAPDVQVAAERAMELAFLDMALAEKEWAAAKAQEAAQAEAAAAAAAAAAAEEAAVFCGSQTPRASSSSEAKVQVLQTAAAAQPALSEDDACFAPDDEADAAEAEGFRSSDFIVVQLPQEANAAEQPAPTTALRPTSSAPESPAFQQENEEGTTPQQEGVDDCGADEWTEVEHPTLADSDDWSLLNCELDPVA